MAYYDIKRITYIIKRGGGTMKSSYCGSVGFKRPQSEYEAKKMAEEWLAKKYPGCVIIELKVELR